MLHKLRRLARPESDWFRCSSAEQLAEGHSLGWTAAEVGVANSDSVLCGPCSATGAKRQAGGDESVHDWPPTQDEPREGFRGSFSQQLKHVRRLSTRPAGENPLDAMAVRVRVPVCHGVTTSTTCSPDRRRSARSIPRRCSSRCPSRRSGLRRAGASNRPTSCHGTRPTLLRDQVVVGMLLQLGNKWVQSGGRRNFGLRHRCGPEPCPYVDEHHRQTSLAEARASWRRPVDDFGGGGRGGQTDDPFLKVDHDESGDEIKLCERHCASFRWVQGICVASNVNHNRPAPRSHCRGAEPIGHGFRAPRGGCSGFELERNVRDGLSPGISRSSAAGPTLLPRL